MALHNWLISLPQTEPIVALNFVFEQTQKVFICSVIFFCLKSPIEIVGPAWAMHFKLNLITVKAELIKKR